MVSSTSETTAAIAAASSGFSCVTLPSIEALASSF
jgi:hypothetical protein